MLAPSALVSLGRRRRLSKHNRAVISVVGASRALFAARRWLEARTTYHPAAAHNSNMMAGVGNVASDCLERASNVAASPAIAATSAAAFCIGICASSNWQAH